MSSFPCQIYDVILGFRNCLFLAGTASNIFANVSFKSSETVIIVDPPRYEMCKRFIIEAALAARKAYIR